MAEGGSPPLRIMDGLHDPGGLHMYSVNGGDHKMAELASPVELGVNNITGPDLGLYGDDTTPTSYPMVNSLQPSLIQVEPASFNCQGSMYQELKRSPPAQLQSYFSGMEPVHDPAVLYNPNTFASGQEVFKAGSDSMGAYLEMLGNSESTGMMNIKQEKPEYTELSAGSNHSSEMSYSHTTCSADWNYYNSNNFLSSTNQTLGSYSNFVAPVGTPYANRVNAPFPSNEEIHNQSKKITQCILGTEWPSDSMYKSRMHSNPEGETVRKRKADVDKSSERNVRARRRKANGVGGHSKTVASILMSNHSAGYKTTESSQPDVLDSSERNALVTKLMDNLRTTVQYESFCLSFPRTETKDNAFRCKVVETSKLVDSLATKKILSEPVLESSVMEASKCLKNFHLALKNLRKTTGTDDEICKASLNKSMSVDQVEEHLPHSMLWVVKFGEQALSASWEGQLVAAVNPIKNLLSISLFQYYPKFSEEGIKCLQQGKLSKELAGDIIDNMEQFEVSRQLRCDVNLGGIAQIYMYKPYTDLHEGCLILEVTGNLNFYQRWLHTSAEDLNKWRQRTDFIHKFARRSTEVIYIGGLVTELNELLAQMLASSSELKQKFMSGVSKPFEVKTVNGLGNAERCQEMEDFKKPVNSSSPRRKRPSRKLGSNVIKLRSEITEVLKCHGIVSTNVVSSTSDEDRDNPSLGIQLPENVCQCFSDYVNFTCDSATELNFILQQKVFPRKNGFYENDFDLSKIPEENIDKITVGELISNRCSEVLYFSFCSKEIGQVGYEGHCSSCRMCRTVRFWHCNTCDQCSQSTSICEFCGHLRHDQTKSVVKPLSVFKSQVATGKVTSDDCKKEWLDSLNLPYDDVLTMDPPNLECQQVEEYNADNAMMDQLGLLNPVGFLLGQPLAGARRKHRQKQLQQPGNAQPTTPKAQSSSGSSCSLQ